MLCANERWDAIPAANFEASSMFAKEIVVDKINQSRRAVFRAAVATGCVLCVPAAFAADGTTKSTKPMPGDASSQVKKMPQASAQYQAKPKGEQKCALCTHFVAESNTCKLVEGKISPDGWCTLWVKKA